MGWHGVTLPGMFKIGVGGCPNNCVKPDLNDVGITGTVLPAGRALLFGMSAYRLRAVASLDRLT